VITLWEALLTVLQYGLLLLHAYAQDKRWPYVSIPLARGERPEDWVPAEDASVDYDDNYDGIGDILPGQNEDIVDIFSAHSYSNEGYHHVSEEDVEESSTGLTLKNKWEDTHWFSIWWQQFVDAATVI
jgi:magnesium/proton exchanger